MGIHEQLVAAGNRGADVWEEEARTKMTVEDDAVMNHEQATW